MNEPQTVDTSETYTGPAGKPVSVVVASGRPLFREALVEALQEDDRFAVVDVVEDGAAAVEACRSGRPRLAVLDDHLNGLRNAALVSALVGVSEDTAVTMIAEAPDQQLVLEAVLAGVRGYLLASETSEAIVEMLWRVAGGEIMLSSGARELLFAAMRSRSQAEAGVPTQRELDIIRLLATGATSRAIGDTLAVSEATVKTYLHRLYEKLGAHDRASAVAEAMRRGWLS